MNNNRNGRFHPVALSALCLLPGSFVGAPHPASAQQAAMEAPLGTVDSGALAKDEAAEAQATRAPSYPRLTGGVAIEVEDDYTFDSEDPTAEINDLYNTTEAALALEFSASTSLNATLVFEPIRDPGPNDDREFEDQGLYMEELYSGMISDPPPRSPASTIPPSAPRGTPRRGSTGPTSPRITN